MYDPRIDRLDSEVFKASFDVENIRENSSYVFCPIKIGECEFQVIFQNSDLDVSSELIEKALDALEHLKYLNRVANEHTPKDDEYTLGFVYVSKDELELHYVYNLANASHGVFFEKNEDNVWVFEDWG
jgi:hypothetical protein